MSGEPRTREAIPADPSRPVLSIVVCTHNRSQGALDIVSRLAPQLGPAGAELIVVDSASEPVHAQALVDGLAGQPATRRARAEQKGVSLARNIGLREARADWVAYIDDDEVPCDDWVARAVALTGRLPPTCGACSGVVLPRIPGPLRDRIGARWRAFLGEFDATGEYDQTEAPRFGVGHSVVRVAAVQDVGGFSNQLGRQGANLLSGEEVLLINQMIERQWRIWHSSAISVDHLVEPARLQRRWAVDRSYWEGVSQARVQRLLKTGGLTGRALLTLAKTVALVLTAVFRPRSRELDLRLAFNLGFIREAFR